MTVWHDWQTVSLPHKEVNIFFPLILLLASVHQSQKNTYSFFLPSSYITEY